MPKGEYTAQRRITFMNKKQGLWLLIGLQLLILAGMFVKALYPLWVGKEILLKVEAKDPRDIFRGNYVELNYTFNRIWLDSVKTDIDSLQATQFTFGDKLYVELKPKDNFQEVVGLWKEKPTTDNVCMQVIVQSKPYYSQIEVKAGVESYFTTQTNAKDLEKSTSWVSKDSVEVSVAVCVASNGAARIKELFVKELK